MAFKGVRQNSLSTPKSPKWDFQKVLFLRPLGGCDKSRKRTFWISGILSYTPFKRYIVRVKL